MENEKRLISLDTACGMLNRFLKNASTNEEKSAIFEVKQSLLEMGRVDAVEVVRCKDCKYHEHYDALLYCEHIGGLAGSVSPNAFCSYGERRTNGQD
jgi:predicted nucleic-acid-binding Zn-ribbon protein